MSLPSKFPKQFQFATATAAYQIEGATRLDGRGISTWDAIRAESGRIHDNSDAELSCDGRLKYKEDVQLLARIGVTSYRFSLSWSRILPDGTLSRVNEEAVQYYRDLCLLLRDNGIEPIRFGDLVKTWITFNEINMQAWSSVVKIDGELWLCPNRPQVDNHEQAPYIAATNMLLAHAKIYRNYEKNYKNEQNGLIGITNGGRFCFAASDSSEDRAARERALDWLFNYTIEPILTESGDFPASMREKLPYLPKFSDEEKELVKGSADFIGINYYLSHLVRNVSGEENPSSQIERDASYAIVEGNWDKICGETWVRYAPDGLLALLKYVKEKYNNVPVFITENGCMDKVGNTGDEDVLEDEHRIKYIAGHLEAVSKALEDGCKVIGYTVWTLMDNFEWDDGFAVKFGICRVDFDSPDKTRTMKHSAKYYQTFIREFKKHHNLS